MLEIENIEQEFKLKLNLKYNIEDYYTLDIFGKKGFFQGKGTLCFSKEVLLSIGKKDFVINDYDSDGYLKTFKKDNLGHYIIELQIGGSYEANCIKIKGEIDNISFEKLINYLKYLKNNKG